MIDIINEKLFHLYTGKSSYVFTIGENGELFHLFYGGRIEADVNSREALMQKWSNGNGCSVVWDEKGNKVCPDDEKYEFSSFGTGDHKETGLYLSFSDGATTVDLRYESHKICKLADVVREYDNASLPHSYAEEEQQALRVVLKDSVKNLRAELIYCIYDDSDCITRSVRLINGEDKPVIIRNLASLQLDMDADCVKVSSFHGDWTREMDKCDTVITGGKLVNDSRTGNSSNHTNPFVMYAEPGCTETAGLCYATNLIYSGNHRESVELGGHAKARIMTGINFDLLEWTLDAGEVFTAPEAVMTFSDTGYRGISEHMHHFVREHIVRGSWKKKERPILLNSWEAAYFKITESGLIKLAKEAKDVGIELFVMDDGWFGKRDNDNCSLGDWYDNEKKLPDGIAGLSKKIKSLGLMFGIWVEPEMVNEDSDLFRAHPDWVVAEPGRTQALGRNQMILDLSRKCVQDYIIDSMTDVFTRGDVDYVKWDMNRNFSDVYSQDGDRTATAHLSHAYILGLYRVMKTLTERFPNILFEGCASGGNRFDLGILSFFPQIWASDDTDAAMRCSIQNGYSYGYPQSTYTAHVSACPNHQTLRVTPLNTRFVVAAQGVFGYELNLCDLSKEELEKIKEQIELYKAHRHTLQYGQLYRTGGSVSENSFEKYSGGFLSTRLDTALLRTNIVSEDKREAVAFLVNGSVKANYSHTYLKVDGLQDDAYYHVFNQKMQHSIMRMGDLVNTMAPIHIKQGSFLHHTLAKFAHLDGEIDEFAVSGSLLHSAGLQLSQAYTGTGYGQNTRLYADYEGKLYVVEAVS